MSIHNGNRHTGIKNLRPDFGFLLGTACLFKGEEEGPENTTDPKAQLVNKLLWVYMLGGRLPSVIPSSELPS